jgi:hypothetical protein
MIKPFRLLTLLAVLLGVLLVAAAPPKPVAAQDAVWFTQFWNNRDLAGATAATRTDQTINFDWGFGSPMPNVNSDNFSARWTRNVNFAPGTYRFTATMDDGMRFFLDGRLLIDSWIDSQERTLTTDVTLTGGTHSLRVDYYDAGGVAIARFGWQEVGAGGGGQQFPNWRAEYWNNSRLEGQPQLVRDEFRVTNDWGRGSPAPGVIATDFFSARWTKTLSSNPGLYRIVLASDDGARVFINNVLVLDGWNVPVVGSPISTDYFYPGGPVTIRVEYYELTLQANIRLDMILIPGTGGGGSIIEQPNLDSNGCVPVQGLWGYVNTGRLNFRTGPDVSFPVVTALNKCAQFGLTGFTNAPRTWVEARLPGGGTGWANAAFTVLGVPITQLTPR